MKCLFNVVFSSSIRYRNAYANEATIRKKTTTTNIHLHKQGCCKTRFHYTVLKDLSIKLDWYWHFLTINWLSCTAFWQNLIGKKKQSSVEIWMSERWRCFWQNSNILCPKAGLILNVILFKLLKFLKHGCDSTQTVAVLLQFKVQTLFSLVLKPGFY